MTREQANDEAKRIFDELVKKKIEIEAEAKKKGIWKMGLDSNSELFKEVNEEMQEKLKLLLEKYNKEK